MDRATRTYEYYLSRGGNEIDMKMFSVHFLHIYVIRLLKKMNALKNGFLWKHQQSHAAFSLLMFFRLF